MTDFRFLTDFRSVPQARDPDRVATGRARWGAAAAAAGEAAFAEALDADDGAPALLAAIFANSPFLTQCMIGDVAAVRRIFEGGPEATAEAAVVAAESAAGEGDRRRLMAGLRRARRRLALAVGMADLAGAWPLATVTATLSRFADAAVGTALAHLVGAAAEAGELALADRHAPLRDCGFAVIALGKLGGRELNYSSDIDLMAIYDAEAAPVTRPERAQSLFAKLTRALVRILQERTPEGFVFRTDLRLRPDPGSTPVAVSLQAAETYYESLGQNWERAAMIKARAIAGDTRLGAAFVAMLEPFIWRRNLDFAAIQDIHSIKRQIHAHHGGGRIGVRGHDLKLGRGGIREIEFFAQTQQLVWGGRDRRLRSAATCEALSALAAAGRIAPEVAEALIEAYGFLRTIEHRLQMMDDRQTQTVPADGAGLDHLAAFAGFADAGAFGEALRRRLETVERHYAALFEEAPALSPQGNLVFTGTADDPGTLATLARMGYRDGRAVGAVVRGWHHGRYRALRSTRARELLTELMPALLAAFARTQSPDAALLRFDGFVARLPAGVQLFALLHANPGLLGLIAEIMGSAPRLAETLSRTPRLLDGVLSGDFDSPPPPRAVLVAEMAAALDEARDEEAVLDALRRAAHERLLQIGGQMLRGLLPADRAGAHLADLADAVLTTLTPRVHAVFAARHGRIAGGGLIILGMGNLGGRAMTVASDLDLMFLYEGAAEASDGARPLPLSQYFTRLGQRLINALTVMTNEGRLYAIDMRLRPSGNKGPMASEIESFLAYQRDDAWTWEHMALTRARVVCGPPALAARLTAGIREVLARRRDSERLRADVADMRARIAAEFPAETPWQVKRVRGGLVDLEFIAEYLALAHAADHPEVLDPDTLAVFAAAARAGLLGADDARTLIAATRLMRRLRGLLKLTIDGARVESEAPEGLRIALARGCGARDFTALRDRLLAVEERVRALYDRLIAQPP